MLLKKERLLLEQINQWLGVLRNSYGTKMISLTDHRILHTCITDLGWFQRKKKQTFSNSRRQLTSSARELEEVSSFIQTYTSWTGHEGIAYKFSTLGWCSTWIMGETKCCWWAQQQLIEISISLDFHHYVNMVIALVRPKDEMMYARGINHE